MYLGVSCFKEATVFERFQAFIDVYMLCTILDHIFLLISNIQTIVTILCKSELQYKCVCMLSIAYRIFVGSKLVDKSWLLIREIG